MTLRASALRENIYRILDEILETGVPVDIEHQGKLLRIAAVEPEGKLAISRTLFDVIATPSRPGHECPG